MRVEQRHDRQRPTRNAGFPLAATCLAILILSSLTACGGGGGGGGGASIYFVRAAVGNDRNDGTSPATAFATIQAAVNRAGNGVQIVVGPGVYTSSQDVVVEVDGDSGSPGAPIEIIGDASGSRTGDPPGDVVVDVSGRLFGFRFSRAAFFVVDGIQIVGSAVTNAAAVQIRDSSSDITIRNCTITDNPDGIRIENSTNILLFNNLIFSNTNRGIQIGSGARSTRVINNTVALNKNDGISAGGNGIRDSFLRNNLVFQNENRGIDFDAGATQGLNSDYNLVSPLIRNDIPVGYGPSTPPGIHDVTTDPLFVDGFRLSQVRGGQDVNSPAVDAGDPDTDGQLEDALGGRTTATNAVLDIPPVDIGFHFPGQFAPPATRTLTMSTPTRAPTVAPTPAIVLYVRASVGSDANTGTSPADALRSIQAAVNRAVPGARIVVGTGEYPESVTIGPPGGQANSPLTLKADVTGVETGDPAGEAIVDPGFIGRGFFVDGGSYVIIDGFTVVASSVAAVHVRRDATGVVVQNCELLGGAEDGIRVQDSNDVTLFNNLIYCNARRGILLGGNAGSQDARIVSNTVVQNGDRGIFIGNATAASKGAYLRNNIIQDNGDAELQVVTDPVSSLDRYDADYNLVFPPGDYAGAEPGPNDVLGRPAGFVRIATCSPIELHLDDYRLSQTLAGQPPPDAPAVNSGDPATPGEFVDPLRERTTATNGGIDASRIDLGYHFAR